MSKNNKNTEEEVYIPKKRVELKTFKVLIPFTYDRAYRKGDFIILGNTNTIEKLINNKIIK